MNDYVNRGMDMNEDNRIRKRIDFNDRVLCYKHIITSSNIKPDPAPIRITIKDISYSGIGISCNRDLGQGDYLMFNLESGGLTKEFMVEVKWCRYNDGAHDAGLQFVNLTKEMILFLDGVIRSHLNKRTRLTR